MTGAGGALCDRRVAGRNRTSGITPCVERIQKLCERFLQNFTHVSLVNGCGYFQPVV